MAVKTRDLEGVRRSGDLFIINPYLIDIEAGFNPRTTINPDRVEMMCTAMISNGVNSFPPVLVVRSGERFLLRTGEHRTLAGRMAIDNGYELEGILARIVPQEVAKTPAEFLALAIAENNGEPLTAEDEGNAYEQLLKLGWDIPKIAQRVGYPESRIKARLDFLAADPSVRAEQQHGQVSVTEVVQAVRTARSKGIPQTEALKEGKERKKIRDTVVKEALAKHKDHTSPPPVPDMTGHIEALPDEWAQAIEYITSHATMDTVLLTLVDIYGKGRILNFLEEQ